MRSLVSLHFVILAIIFLLNAIGSDAVSCKNQNRESVDWYYLYKLPKHHSTTPGDTSGLRYLYITSSTLDKGWQLASDYINSNDSIPGQTLIPVLQNESVLSLAYNDEEPDGGQVNNLDGHTKGVVATDGASGLWLIHSVPKYPSINGVYTYPETGEHFGQSFLCISLNSSQLNLVGEQLMFNEPNIYHSRMPKSLQGLFPNLEAAIRRDWRKTGPFNNQISLSSVGGAVFEVFAKGRRFNKELYEDWVAQILEADFYVETWRNGPGALASNCSRPKKVYNVNRVELKDLKIDFKSSTDHSKWAVAVQENTPWICVGDINRAEHQLIRGGGTICSKRSELSNLYRQIVEGFDICQKSN